MVLPALDGAGIGALLHPHREGHSLARGDLFTFLSWNQAHRIARVLGSHFGQRQQLLPGDVERETMQILMLKIAAQLLGFDAGLKKARDEQHTCIPNITGGRCWNSDLPAAKTDFSHAFQQGRTVIGGLAILGQHLAVGFGLWAANALALQLPILLVGPAVIGQRNQLGLFSPLIRRQKSQQLQLSLVLRIKIPVERDECILLREGKNLPKQRKSHR